HALHRIAHGRQIDDRRDAGEVLHQYAGGAKGDLAGRAPGLQPARHRPDILGPDRTPILVAQQVLEQDLEAEGQAGDGPETILLRGFEAEIVEATRADLEAAARLETVHGGHGEFSLRDPWRGRG